jgi:hypothetical protein
MFFGEIYDSIRGRIDRRQKIKPKSDRLLGGALHIGGSNLTYACGAESSAAKPHLA